jgi:DNA-binding PadR family transcriptional regulator
MDFDPRSIDDSRDRDIDGRELNQGSRGGLSNPRERERLDPRDAFTRDLELPRGRERKRVWAGDSDVTLRGSEVRTMATVGAFRVVPAGDLRDGNDRPLDPHRGDLRHLKDSGLVDTVPAGGDDRALVVLTERGRDVLERNRWSTVHADELRWEAIDRECGRIPDDGRSREARPQQEFHVGIRSIRHTRFAVHRPRELMHDSHVHRAYLKEADRLREDGAFIRRVVLDHELKREYQQFLQERNRGKSDSDGRPDRTPEEIHRWAVEHELPEHDGHVQFPDARIEYEDRDGHLRTLDIEVETLHYRGAHAVSKASSGFSRHSAGTARVISSRGTGGAGGRRGSRGLGLTVSTNGRSGGRAPDPRLAEESLK